MPDDPFVSPEWLHEHLGDTRVKVLDGSWFLPGDPRDPKAAFLEGHIPGAQFFDIDEIADKTSSMTHMAPTPEQFAYQVGELGIGGDDAPQPFFERLHVRRIVLLHRQRNRRWGRAVNPA